MAFWDDVWEVVKTLPMSASVGLPGRGAPPPMSLNQIIEALPRTQRTRAAVEADAMEQAGLVPPGTSTRVRRGEVDRQSLETLSHVYQATPLGKAHPDLIAALYPSTSTYTHPPAPDSAAGIAWEKAPAQTEPPGSGVAASGPTFIPAPSPPLTPDRNAFLRNLAGLLPVSQLGTLYTAATRQHDLEAQRHDAAQQEQQARDWWLQQQQVLQANREALQREKAPSGQVKLTLPQRAVLNRLYPGRTLESLRPEEQQRFYDEVQRAGLTDYRDKLRARAGIKEHENAAKMAQEMTVAEASWQQMYDLVDRTFRTDGPPQDAGPYAQIKALWQQYATKGSRAWESLVQPEQSVVRQYNDAIGFHVLTMVRAFARTGRISNQEMTMLKSMIPSLEGTHWWSTPDTRGVALDKLQRLKAMIDTIRGRPANPAVGFDVKAPDPANPQTWGVDPTYRNPYTESSAPPVPTAADEAQYRQDYETLEDVAPTAPPAQE
jgi:hypothetical protein